MRKKFLAFGMTAMLSVGLALAGMTACNAEKFSYDNSNRYSVGNASMTSAVTEVEVEWLSGKVNVVYGDVERVSFAETSAETLTDDITLHYWLDNTTLHIKYAKSGIMLTNQQYPDKELTVTLPSSLSLNKIEVESVDADITLTGLNATEIEVESIAGNIVCELATVGELSVESVSGNVDVKAAALTEFDVEAVHGDISLTCQQAPKRGSLDSVSGAVLLTLPKETGFSVEIENASGSFESEFEMVQNGNKYVCGNGENAYEIEIGTGSAKIRKGN